MPTRALCPVLVGRENELGILEEALINASSGEGQVLLVSGEAGLGKTRLCLELTRRAGKIGMEVLWGGCSEAELALPYLPFLESLGNHLATVDPADLDELGPARAELAGLFPQLGVPSLAGDRGDPAQGRLRLFEAVLALLNICARPPGLLIVIEDLHWSDAGTRELLDYLSRRLRESRALIVGTYRADEMHRRHPLLPLVQSLRRAGTNVVELSPLPPESIGLMVSAIFDEPTREDTREFLHSRSEGNPFVLEELLKAALDRGDIYRSETGWERKPLGDIRLPASVRDNILLRVERLTDPQLDVLRAGAVLGAAFEYSLLVGVSGQSEDDVLTALAAFIERQLLVELPGDRDGYRFRHALTREVVYSEMVSPKRRQLHQRAAAILAEDPATPTVAIAHHLVEAGDWKTAVPICVKAAEEAISQWAAGDAADLLERALEHVDGDVEQARLLCQVGRAYQLSGEPGRAETRFRDAIARFDVAGERSEAARWRLQLGRVLWELARRDEAMLELNQALAVLEPAGPSAELAEAYHRLATLHVFNLECAAAMDFAERAIAVSREVGDRSMEIWTYNFLGLAMADLGSLDEGLDYIDRSYREASAAGLHYIANNALFNWVWPAGIGRRARESLPRLQLLRSQPPRKQTQMLADTGEAFTHLRLGHPAVAEERARIAMAAAVEGGSLNMAKRAERFLGWALVELDQLEEAARHADPPTAAWERQDLTWGSPAWYLLCRARGDLAAAAAGIERIFAEREIFNINAGMLDLAAEAKLAIGDRTSAELLLATASAVEDNAGDPHLLRLEGRLETDGKRKRELFQAAAQGFAAIGYELEELRSRLLAADQLEHDGAAEAAGAELREILAGAERLDARLLARQMRERLGIEAPAAAVGEEALTPGERLVTVLFADVRGYTELSGGLAPAEVVDRLASLQRWATSAVEQHHGTIDKFAGDSVMATFNVSGLQVDHALHAFRAAQMIRDRARLAGVPVGIGIATGAAVVGRLAQGANLSVIGATTNLAARLQAAAGPGEVLVSAETRRRLGDGDGMEDVTLRLKGFDDPVEAYRLPSPA